MNMNTVKEAKSAGGGNSKEKSPKIRPSEAGDLPPIKVRLGMI